MRSRKKTVIRSSCPEVALLNLHAKLAQNLQPLQQNRIIRKINPNEPQQLKFWRLQSNTLFRPSMSSQKNQTLQRCKVVHLNRLMNLAANNAMVTVVQLRLKNLTKLYQILINKNKQRNNKITITTKLIINKMKMLPSPRTSACSALWPPDNHLVRDKKLWSPL